MAGYEYLTDRGVILPDTADLLEEVQDEWTTALGADLILDQETPQGVLMTSDVVARDKVIADNAALANQINPNEAGGAALEAIGKLTGIEREGGRRTRVMATLAGVPSVTVPAGRKVKTRKGYVFYTAEPVVLGADGKAEVYCYSDDVGAIPCAEGELDSILPGQSVLGWETITNTHAGEMGRKVEHDSAFRRRRGLTLYKQGVALPGALQSAVYDVEGVRSLKFLENYTSEEKEMYGVVLPPHHIWLCVDGGEDADIARAIFDNKSLGCGYAGNAASGRLVAMDVTEPVSGQAYPVQFERPELVPVRCIVTVRNFGGTIVDAVAIVKDAIVAYSHNALWELVRDNPDALQKAEALPGFSTGVLVSPFEMAAAVALVAPQLFVLSVRVGLLTAEDDALAAVTLPMEVWQKAIITHGSIAVQEG